MKTKAQKPVGPKLTDWSNAKPPMIGEYIASLHRNSEIRRWWDGKRWSIGYLLTDRPHSIQRSRRQQSGHVVRAIWWRGLAEKPENFVPPEPLGPL